ncbi:TonB-dependent receptor [Acetobacter orientalis]|uniref:TonB-dependent receptor n=1 Tax=Acetobacter orientalis TaxID=146474 RepID=A0A2Z5ZES5_9PROT|nr:TonB-dependent receptor [Acetobacter orientalis]
MRMPAKTNLPQPATNTLFVAPLCTLSLLCSFSPLGAACQD